MKIGALLAINSLIATFFGIAFTLVPGQLLALYGVELPLAGLLLARLFGTSLIAFGIVSWLLRAGDASAQRAAAIAIVVADGIAALIAIWGVVTGAFNSLGWSTVAVYVILAGAFAVHLVRHPAIAPASA